MKEQQAKTLECRKVPPLEVDAALGSAVWHTCSGSACMSWRWLPMLASDPSWIAAVQKAATEINDTTPNRLKAAQHVEKNRARYGLPVKSEHGYCGRDSKPEVR